MTSIGAKLDFLVDIVQQVNINTQTLEHKMENLDKKLSSLDKGKSSNVKQSLRGQLFVNLTGVIYFKLDTLRLRREGIHVVVHVLFQTCQGSLSSSRSRTDTCKLESVAWAVNRGHQAIQAVCFLK